MISTDVLSDAACFTGGHFGAANVVEQTRFTVVNVTHDGNHRRTRKGFCRVFLHHVAQNGFRIIGFGGNRVMAHFFDHNHRRVLIEHLVNRHHLPHLHQSLNHFGGFHSHLVSKVGHADRLRNAHFAHHGFSVLNRLRLRLLMAAVVAVFTAAAPLFIAIIFFIDDAGVALIAAAKLRALIIPLAATAMAGAGVFTALFLGILIFVAVAIVILAALFLILRLLRISRLITLGFHHRGLGLIHHLTDRTGFFFGLTASFLTTLQFFFRRRRFFSLRRSLFHAALRARLIVFAHFRLNGSRLRFLSGLRTFFSANLRLFFLLFFGFHFRLSLAFFSLLLRLSCFGFCLRASLGFSLSFLSFKLFLRFSFCR